MRPKQPRFTDHRDPDSYYNLNRYYNAAEKLFDAIERLMAKADKPIQDLVWFTELSKLLERGDDF